MTLSPPLSSKMSTLLENSLCNTNTLPQCPGPSLVLPEILSETVLFAAAPPIYHRGQLTRALLLTAVQHQEVATILSDQADRRPA